jgi:hypothetical protein
MDLRALACAAALAALAACEAVPDLTYPPRDAAAESAPRDAPGADSPVSSDAPDEATPAGDAVDDAPSCTLPPGGGAMCCPLTTAPCVGLACSHCPDCATAACQANQFCCAQLKGQGDYKGVICAPDTRNCP